MTAAKPRVFLLSDYFTRRKDFYLIAESEPDACEKGHITIPVYREVSDEVFESTEVQEEVMISLLTRIAPLTDQTQQVYVLLTQEDEEMDAYRGYEISREYEMSPVEAVYPKSEWHLEK